MARVHMFKSSFDKHNKEVNVQQPEDLPASPSMKLENINIEVGAESTQSPESGSTLTQFNQNESAALTAALLQKAPNATHLASAVAAVLSAKPSTLEDLLSDETQRQLLSTLHQHQADTDQINLRDSSVEQAKIQNVNENSITNQEQQQSSKPEAVNEFMDQAAAATALQLLGLAQQDNTSKANETISSTNMTSNPTSPSLENNTMMIVDYPHGLNLTGITQQQQSPQTQMHFSEQNNGIEEIGQKRGAWTREEDDLLLAGIKKYGYGRWKEIASIIPGRKGKQLKQRWDNTLAAKYVDQEWLQNKIRDGAEVDRQQQQQQSNLNDELKALAGNSSGVQKLTDPATAITDLTDWTLIAHKISEKLKEGDQVAIEALISQALLSTLNSTASTTANTAASSPGLKSNATSPSILSFADLFAQQHISDNNNAVISDQQSSFFIPHTSAIQPKKRKRSNPTLANTQSDAMSIYASAPPITTTVDNQTQTLYPCLFPECGKTFTRLYNLKSHSRTHTDDRPFACQVCRISFSRNHDLKRHFKIHGGDKPYKCTGCSKTFSRLDALKRHKSNQRNKTTCVNTSAL